jgi:bifunctional non-homologous end joining protein LigD
MGLFEQKISPMLSQPASPADRDGYIHEPKWDGTRCIAYLSKKDGSVRLLNRRLVEMSNRYPELSKLYEDIKCAEAILDGEIVVLQNGKPDFSKLQEREHLQDPFLIEIRSRLIPATFMVFDLLYVDGADVTREPLLRRKRLLEDVVRESDRLLLTDFVEGDGLAYFKKARKLGLEGIMAKRADSPYLIGKRSNLWLKVKSINTVDCVVCGYTEGEGRRKGTFGALLLGLYKQDKLVYVGRVGTGFTDAQLHEYAELIGGYRADSSPFAEGAGYRGKHKVVWLKPELVAEVKYMGFARQGGLRAPSFRRWRTDKPAKQCTFPGAED